MNDMNRRTLVGAMVGFCLCAVGAKPTMQPQDTQGDPKNVANHEAMLRVAPAPLPGEPSAILFVRSEWGWMSAGGGLLQYCVRPKVRVAAASPTSRNPTKLQVLSNWTQPITFTLLNAQKQQLANAAPWFVPMPIAPGQTVEMPVPWCQIVQSPQGPPTLFLQVGDTTERVQFNVPQRRQPPPKVKE